jgi:arginase
MQGGGAPRRVVVLDAPSNLGLRPPAPGTVPGCYKLAGALRDRRILERLWASDAGVAVPPRYDRGGWEPGDGVFNAAALAAYARRLAGRVAEATGEGRLLLVLGGDCSILLGTMLGLSRRGRHGLAFIDGHSDFRHPGNSGNVGAAAGEDLALVTGRGQADLTGLTGAPALVRDEDVVVLGIRDGDEYRGELRGLSIACLSEGELRAAGAGAAARRALDRLEAPDLNGFWVHLDCDVLDSTVMPAVDTPGPGGLAHAELVELLAPLAASPRCRGVEVVVFDPDLDPDGRLAGELTDTLVAALGPR